MSVILEHKNHLKYSAERGNFQQLFNFLANAIKEDSYLYRKLISTYARHQDLMPHKINETMPIDIIKLEENRIYTSLMEIIDKLTQSDIRPNLELEISYEKTPKTKNTVIGNDTPHTNAWTRIVKWFREKF